LQQVAGQVAALDLGFKPYHNLPAAKVLYLLGADNESLTKCKPAGTTVIYQGKHNFNLLALLFVISCMYVKNSINSHSIIMG